MKFQAAIMTKHNVPLEVVTLEHEIIGASSTCSVGQVRVEMLLSGICGAQLGEIAGTKNPDAPLPRLLGHEGCGVVREVGPGVSTQLMGKKVVCHWRKGEGPHSFSPARYQWGNKTIGGGDIVTFTQSAVMSANRVTVVPDSVPEEVCALLGCGLSTALGTIEQEAKLRFGESVLILGCGGVGLNLILAAKAAGAGEITVVDKDKSKEALAKSAGATHFFGVKDFVEWPRFDIIIDTTGSAQVLEQTIPLLSGTGRMVILGQTKPGQGFEIRDAVSRFYGEGSRIIWSQGGGFNPTKDIPRYVSMWQTNRLNLDTVISHRIPLEKINEGLDLVRNGQAGRVMVTFK